VRSQCNSVIESLDASKDQSYFAQVKSKAARQYFISFGEIHKTEVRKIAEQLQLPNAKKKDSTGICFIGERPFREFLNRYLSYKPGAIKTPEEETIGQHVGLSFYTLGQRKGIGIGGIKSHQNADGSSDAWYVARKDVAENTLYAVQGHDHPGCCLLHSMQPESAGSQAALLKSASYQQKHAIVNPTSVVISPEIMSNSIYISIRHNGRLRRGNLPFCMMVTSVSAEVLFILQAQKNEFCGTENLRQKTMNDRFRQD
jgi:tRNA U34 2-thiouridine synthase MnmA/TrmU